MLRKAVSWHLFLWPTVCEWHSTCWERQSHHILSYEQQFVSELVHCVQAIHHIFSYDQQSVSDIPHFGESHHIFSYDQQFVCDIANSVKGSLTHLFIWSTGCKWHCTLCEPQSHHIFSYNQQSVSDIAHFVKRSLTVRVFSMANSLWVTLLIFERQSCHFFSMNNRKWVTLKITVKGSLIISVPMTNSLWVTWPFLKIHPHHIFSHD